MAAQAPPAMASPSQPDDSLPPYSSSALTTGEALPTPKQELDKKFEVKIDLVPDAADPADPQDWLCTIEFKIHDLEQVMRKGLAWTGANVVRKRGFYNDRLKESPDTRFTVKRTWYLRDNPSLPDAENAWTATAKIWAHEIPQLASFRLGKLGRGNVSVVKAHNEEGKRVFCYERLKPERNINVYLDDEDDESVKAAEWWFWPVDGRGIVGEGVVERVKGEKKVEEKKTEEIKEEKKAETKEVKTVADKKAQTKTEDNQVTAAPPSKSWSLLKFSLSVDKAAEKSWENVQQKQPKQKGKQDAKPAPDAQDDKKDKQQQDDKKDDKKKGTKDDGKQKQKQKPENDNGKSLTKTTTDQKGWSFAVSWSVFEFARPPRGQQAGEGKQVSGGRTPWWKRS